MTTPSIRTRFALPAAVLALAVSLSGCISVFPKATPVQLYRLGQAAAPPAAAAPQGLVLAKAPTLFPPDAAGDRLLTVNGPEAAFIADARWLEPASVMFDEAITAAFDQPGSPRLATRGENLATGGTLRLEVRRFQVDYDHGAAGAPTVEITVNAVLVRNADRSAAAEKLFEIRQPADDNRVGAIVTAYNAAVAQAAGQIRDWTSLNAAQIRS